MSRTAKSVYIQAQDGSKFFFDAVLEVTYQQSGSPSEYAVESGINVSDHYTQNNDTINIMGSVSKTKFIASGLDSTLLEDFERGITDLKKSGQFFSVSFSDNLDVLPNCLFTALDIKRSTATGKYSIDVSASIRQIVVAARANVVTTPVPAKEYADVVEQRERASGNSVEPTKTQTQQIRDVMIETRNAGIYETGTGAEDATLRFLE